jgi:hypothetical protein
MNIEEAVAKSAESLTIFIVKEALFCNVYEESAWRFNAERCHQRLEPELQQ